MPTTNNFQSRTHKYGDGSNDESSSFASSFSNNQENQEQPLAPGGFTNPLKAHEGHFYLHPCIEMWLTQSPFLNTTSTMTTIWFQLLLCFRLTSFLPIWEPDLGVLTPTIDGLNVWLLQKKLIGSSGEYSKPSTWPVTMWNPIIP